MLLAEANNTATNAPATTSKRDGMAETTTSKERAKEEASAVEKSRIAFLRGLLGGGNNGEELLCLISRGCSHDQCQSSNQSRALEWLASRGVPHSVMDGTDPDACNLRKRLFGISGTRGGYSQFFVVT
jgi:hypothetical protein